MRNKNLIFISLPLLRLKYGIKLKNTIKIKSGKSVQITLNNLRYELLKQKQNQFNFLKDISRDLYNPTRINKHKRAVRLSKKFLIPKIADVSELKISLKKLGGIINLSSSSAFNLIKNKVKERKAKIIKEKFTKTVFTYSGSINKFLPGYTKNGFLYIPKCNKYVFL